MIGQDMLGFGMTILIFMMIILYGNWIAMSVVEEKSSRVMEVILNAATPFQLLTGKVLGVGAVALTQYAALLLTGVIAPARAGHGRDASSSGTSGGVALPEGLTIELLLLFGVYGILGFLLYAVLYAGAGSLVSRQEDVNSAVMPMTLVSTVGYMHRGVRGHGPARHPGRLDVGRSPRCPFVSPFMMLGRITTGEAARLGGGRCRWSSSWSRSSARLWLAARIYAAGVLLYGQRPGMRAILRLVRSGT